MSGIEIFGGKRLYGDVKIQGSKNAVLPILAACILNKGIITLNNCPRILDVYNMIKILEEIGAVVTWENNSIIVDTTTLNSSVVPGKYVKEMRSSIIVLGALLGRLKNVTISYPGGCSIGARPIDLHLSALKRLNVEIEEEEDTIVCKTNRIIGNEIFLKFPSVGATENIILATVLSNGITQINNAAKEPEIIELSEFLNTLGAKIIGAGTSIITIEGVSKLHDGEYTLIADRIVAGTYMAALAGVGGNIELTGVSNSQLSAVISVIREIGCKVTSKSDFIRISSHKKPKAVDIIRTGPYPEFPTDMQSQIMTVLTKAKGTSVIIENIFEARYKTADELKKMNANITIEGNVAIIKGVKHLSGEEVLSHDLRGGAALVIAGLMANGKSTIINSNYIERGYEDICRDFTLLGADLKWIER